MPAETHDPIEGPPRIPARPSGLASVPGRGPDHAAAASGRAIRPSRGGPGRDRNRPLNVRALDISILLATEAAHLDPTPERWRTLLKLADLAERTELRSEALRRLKTLDPHDEVVRLLYINDAIERYQTAEQRIAVYEAILAPKNREALGPAVTSRLANDLGLADGPLR